MSASRRLHGPLVGGDCEPVFYTKILELGPALRYNKGVTPGPTESISSTAPKVWNTPLGVSDGIKDVLREDFVSKTFEFGFDIAADVRWKKH